MIYVHKITGEKITIRKDAVGDYVMPDGTKTSKYFIQKNFRFSRKDSKPIRRQISLDTFRRAVRD